MKKVFIMLVGILLLPVGAIANSSIRFNNNQLQTAYQIRQACAYNDSLGQPFVPMDNLNPDETNIANYAAMFSKGLAHDLISGVLTAAGQIHYQQLLIAMQNGSQSSFNAIQLAGVLKFVDPQGGMEFCLQGKDSSLHKANQPFSITTSFGAVNLLEIYWMSMARDVLFSDYGTGTGTDANGLGGSITNDAASVLQSFGATYLGPKAPGGIVNAGVIFRGNYPGALVGPYISQFFWQPERRWHIAPLTQLIPTAPTQNYDVSWNQFITLQNGVIPTVAAPFGPERYISSGRDLAHAVHNDCLYESYYTAAFILTDNGFPYSPAFPYNNGSMPNEAPFVSLGKPDVFAAFGAVSAEALKAAWANKWRTYRVLRPEEFGGLVHQAKSTSTNPYGIDSSMFSIHAGIDTLARVLAYNERQSINYPFENVNTYLLSQAYPEGCPLHPSYTSGHATVGGACITVIKAYFDNNAPIHSYVIPVIPNPVNTAQLIPLADGSQNFLTVGGELDKLATNVANGRNWSGIHYRQDADWGILLGEQVAIGWLIDQAKLYNEQLFTGFQLTTFNGQTIQITASGVTLLS